MGVASSTPCEVPAAAEDQCPALEHASLHLPSSMKKCPNLCNRNDSDVDTATKVLMQPTTA